MQERSAKLSSDRILNIISGFLEGKRRNIEPVELESGVNGIRKIYIIPVGVWHGRGQLELPKVVEAKLVDRTGKHTFGKVAVKDYKTAIKEEDAPTLLPPTVAHMKNVTWGLEKRDSKLAVQMWMAEPSAEEYLLEIAKVRHAWNHLVTKRRNDVTISDLAPENVKKWVVDLDVYNKATAREWMRIGIREFLDKYGDDGLLAVERVARIAGIKNPEGLVEKLRRGKITDDVLESLDKVWERLPRTKYFWEHHVNKDLEILNSISRYGKLSERRRDNIRRLAEWLKLHGHKNYPVSILNLIELERNIVAEWIAIYKRELKKASAK